MCFKDLNVKIKYQSFVDEPVNNFYIPVLSNSAVYKRAVWYFSSSVLLDYAKGFKDFYRNNGEIKSIISPYLNESDINNIGEVYKKKYKQNLYNKMDKAAIMDQLDISKIDYPLNQGRPSLK